MAGLECVDVRYGIKSMTIANLRKHLVAFSIPGEEAQRIRTLVTDDASVRGAVSQVLREEVDNAEVLRSAMGKSAEPIVLLGPPAPSHISDKPLGWAAGACTENTTQEGEG